MHDAHEFLVRQVPEPVVFLGLRLKPFSLGHYILLARFDNAFITGKEVQIHDLLMAAFILSRSFAEASEKMEGGEHLSWARDFSESFKQVPLVFDEAAEFLREHLAEQFQIVPYRSATKHTTTLNAPLLAVLKRFLCEKMNLRPAEALDYPFSLAYYEYLVWLESEGAIVISSVAEEKARAEAIAEYAKKHPEYA